MAGIYRPWSISPRSNEVDEVARWERHMSSFDGQYSRLVLVGCHSEPRRLRHVWKLRPCHLHFVLQPKTDSWGSCNNPKCSLSTSYDGWMNYAHCRQSKFFRTQSRAMGEDYQAHQVTNGVAKPMPARFCSSVLIRFCELVRLISLSVVEIDNQLQLSLQTG